MEESILISTKKVLGLSSDSTDFDLDVITHINASFSILNQLGVGPEASFFIEDDTAVWADFGAPDNQLNLVKTYIYLKVRILFDPPQIGFLMDAAQKQVLEYEWRLNTFREYALQIPPDPVWPQTSPITQAQVAQPAGTRWIDYNIDPISGGPLDGA